MSEPVDTVSATMPSAAPSEADVAAWALLPRDEQRRRMQTMLAHPDCSTASSATMSEILERARTAAKRRNG